MLGEIPGTVFRVRGGGSKLKKSIQRVFEPRNYIVFNTLF